VLEGQGKSSLLESGWNADDLEREAYTEALSEPSYRSKRRRSEKLKELDDLFSCGI